MAKKWLVFLICFFASTFSILAQEKTKVLSSISSISMNRDEFGGVTKIGTAEVEVKLEILPSDSGYNVSRILQSDKYLKIELENISLNEGALEQLYLDGGSYYHFSDDKAVKWVLVRESRNDHVSIEFEHSAQPVAYLINQSDNKLLIHIEPVAEKQERISGYYEKEMLSAILVDIAGAASEQVFVFDEAGNTPKMWLSNMPQSKIMEVILQANELASQKFNSINVIAPKEVLHNFETMRSAKKWKGERITLWFGNIDLKRSLRILVGFSGQMLVSTKADLGSLGVKVKDTPWTQIFDYIMASKDGLVAKEIDGMMVIAYPQEIKLAQERGCFKSILAQARKETTIMLNHIHSDDVAPKIQNLLDNDLLPAQLCEGLETKSYASTMSTGDQVSFQASADITKQIKLLVQEMDQPKKLDEEKMQ